MYNHRHHPIAPSKTDTLLVVRSLDVTRMSLPTGFGGLVIPLSPLSEASWQTQRRPWLLFAAGVRAEPPPSEAEEGGLVPGPRGPRP